jgi:hypothetical protein
MQPTFVVFQSPDHDVNFANGNPKVVNYRVIVVPTNDPNQTPSAQMVKPKNDAVPEGADRKLDVTELMNQLLPDYFGYLFVRAENPTINGSYGDGQSFLKAAAPEACNVVAVV